MAHVEAAVGSQFPALAGLRARPLGSGWDCDAWMLGEQWVFRFPREKKVAENLANEVRLVALASRRLAGAPLAVPRFDHLGEPGPHFPYPFVGYRALPGVGGDRVDPQRLRRPELAVALGRTFAHLHTTPLEEALAAGVRTEPDSAREWLRDAAAARREIETALPPDLRSAAAAILRGEVEPMPAPAEPHALIHDDICPDHVLVDPRTGLGTGLIDFGDLALGDPALDFVGLWSWLGADFAREVIAAYAAPLDGDFFARLRQLTRACSLCWLVDSLHCIDEGDRDADVAKHVGWIRQAFSD